MPGIYRTIGFPTEFESIILHAPGSGEIPFAFRDFLVTFEFWDADQIKLEHGDIDTAVTSAFNAPFQYLRYLSVEETNIGTGILKLLRPATTAKVGIHPWQKSDEIALNEIAEKMLVSVSTIKPATSLTRKLI